MRRSLMKQNPSVEEARQERRKYWVEIRKGRREEAFKQKRAARTAQSPIPGLPNLSLLPASDLLQPNTNCTNQAPHGEIQQLCDTFMNSREDQVWLQCAFQIRSLLAVGHHPSIQRVVDAGAVPRLVYFLQLDNSPKLQFEAAGALAYIASGASAHAAAVVEAGAVPLLVALVHSPTEDVAEQAVRGLGNIAGDSVACRDNVLEYGTLPAVISLLNRISSLSSLLSNTTWLLSNLLRGTPSPSQTALSPPHEIMRCLDRLICFDDENIITDACWALSFLSQDCGRFVLEQSSINRLILLLTYSHEAILSTALCTICNVVTGDSKQAKVFIECGVLSALTLLVESPTRNIRREACRLICSITAGPPSQIQAVIAANVIPSLLRLLSLGEFEFRNEAAWAVHNCTSRGIASQIEYLVQMGCIGPMCDALTMQDNRLVALCLDGLQHILRHGKFGVGSEDESRYAVHVADIGGLDAMEALREHPNSAIHRQSNYVLETYFARYHD